MSGNKMLKTLIKIKDECNKHPGCMGCKHNKIIEDEEYPVRDGWTGSHMKHCEYTDVYTIAPCYWSLPRIKEKKNEK